MQQAQEAQQAQQAQQQQQQQQQQLLQQQQAKTQAQAQAQAQAEAEVKAKAKAQAQKEKEEALIAEQKLQKQQQAEASRRIAAEKQAEELRAAEEERKRIIQEHNADQKPQKSKGPAWQTPTSGGTKAITAIQAEEARKAAASPQTMGLKSMLGMTGNKTGWTGNKGQASTTQSGPSLREIQDKEERASNIQKDAKAKAIKEQVRAQATADALAEAANNKSLPSKWAGGAATPPSPASGGPSLMEIMKAEEQQSKIGIANGTAAQRAAAQHSWAAKITTGPTSVSASTTAKANPPQQAAAQSNSVKQQQMEQARALQLARANELKAQQQKQQQQQQQQKQKATAPSSKPAKQTSDFGDNLSPQLTEWCSSHMSKINGSTDLTLVQYCAGLDSGIEIREIIAATLGSTPQVSQFATEFIRRKDLQSAPTSTKNSKSSAGADGGMITAGSNKANKKKTTGKPK
jgi:hypothetical protein